MIFFLIICHSHERTEEQRVQNKSTYRRKTKKTNAAHFLRLAFTLNKKKNANKKIK